MLIYATVIYAIHKRNAAYEWIIGNYGIVSSLVVDPDPDGFVLFELMDPYP